MGAHTEEKLVVVGGDVGAQLDAVTVARLGVELGQHSLGHFVAHVVEQHVQQGCIWRSDKGT